METFITETSKDYSLLDNHTGEILEYKKTRKVTLEEFMMIFFASYSEMFVLSGIQIKVLMCCWRYSSYNDKNCNVGNIVYNNTLFKDNCRKDGMQTSDAVIDNAISQLAKFKFLIKQCKGTYLLNPQYFFKGTLSDRTKIMYNIMVEPEERKRQENINEINKLFQQQLEEENK